MKLDDSDFWGAVIAFVAFAIPFIYSVLEKGREKKRLAISFYEQYHSIDFYGKIRAPMWRIRCKWFEPGERCEDYRKAVIAGWVGFEKDSQLEIEKADKTNLTPDRITYMEHHADASPLSGLTEHQVLTLGLEFWCTLNILRKKRLIDTGTLSIFKRKYRYDAEFIHSLRSAVTGELKKHGKSVDDYPAWLTETRELEDFFNRN